MSDSDLLFTVTFQPCCSQTVLMFHISALLQSDDSQVAHFKLDATRRFNKIVQISLREKSRVRVTRVAG